MLLTKVKTAIFFLSAFVGLSYVLIGTWVRYCNCNHRKDIPAGRLKC